MRLPVLVAVLVLAVPAAARAAEGDIIVQRAPGLGSAERRELRRDAGVELVGALPLERTELVSAEDPDAALAALRADADVVYAEPDRRVTLARTMSDAFFSSQWGLQNTGQSIAGQAGTIGDDIHATAAWDVTLGAGVTVAVVDSGISSSHVDLVNQIAGNAAEVNGLPGVDDDGNGYIDDARGWDFVDHDPLPQDGNGHGTHVAGTIAAEAENNVGTVGVAPQAKVLPLRVLASNGTGWMSDIAAAFAYAGDLGIRIVNASLSGPYSKVLQDAIASHPNTLYVVAAGNEGADAETSANAFPCALPLRNVICVGASDNRDQVASFSNVGLTSVDLFAPGVAIYSAYRGSTTAYRLLDGTSMAAPHVAGAAALALSVRPAASIGFLRWALLSSVDAEPPMAGKAATGGRLNADAAVRAIQGREPAAAATPTPAPPAAAPTPAAAPPTGVSAPTAPSVAVAPVMAAPVLALGRLTITRKLRVSLHLSAPAELRFAIARKGVRKPVATWHKLGRAGANTFTLPRRLKPGTYVLTVTAGSATTASTHLRIP